MKKIALLTLATLLAAPVFAQTADERAAAAVYLKKTEADLLAATKGLSEAQLNFKPAPERWSAAEVLEHIASAEDFLFGLVQEQVMKAPARPAGEDVKAIDEFVLKAIPDRSHKVKAAEPLVPKNRYGSTGQTLQHFAASRAKTAAFLEQTQGLRDHAIDSPLGKKLDGYQWILFIAAHSERHTKQILEVKNDPGFPKS